MRTRDNIFVGVGITVVNALSSYFKMVAYRDIEKTCHTIEFEDGILKSDTIKKNVSGKHGTITAFKVNKKYMGEDAKLPYKDVINWIDSLFYLREAKLREKGIKCTFTVTDGLNVIETVKFKPRPFSDLIKKLIPATYTKKDLSSLCTFHNTVSFTEESKVLIEDDNGETHVEMDNVEKELYMDVAFLYCINPDASDGANYDTYANYTNTIDNGTHLEVFDDTFCKFIFKKTNETISDNQKSKLKILWDDIRSNFYCVINLSSNAQIGFEGNAKNKILCPNLVPHMKKLLNDGLTKYFNDNPSQLNEIIKIVKLNAKARLEAAKAKSAVQVEHLNSFKEHSMTNFIRCNNTGKKFKEICLVEGNSASSSVRNGSDPDTQALFLLRGVTANPMKCSLSEIMENREWRDLVSVLKCGIGEKFDLSKLYYDRINIMTDADVDGYYISAGILVFFYMYLRPIIEAGKLYKVFTPLYVTYDKERPYVSNKAEMVSIHQKMIIKNYKIKLEGSSDYLSKDELHDFLIETYEYREDLIRAAENSGNINKFLVESVISYLSMSNVVRNENDYDDINEILNTQKFVTKFMSHIQKKFKEVILDKHQRISGVVDGKRAIIKIDKRFFKKTADLIPIYKKYGYMLTVKEKDKDPVKMTIGEFLDTTMKLQLKIKNRIKGLGELNSNQLHATAMDINNRVSVQYTVDDVEREIKIFELTHGATIKDREARKEMMKAYKIKRDDLDN